MSSEVPPSTDASQLVNVNPLLAVNRDKTEDDFGWDDVVDDVLEQMTLWTAFYTCEKIMILYITIHYHYRSDLNKITHSKEMHNALIKLYEASTYLYPVGCKEFAREDLLIRNAKGNEKASSRVRVTSYLARLGIDGYKLTSFFGNFIDNDPRSHWLRPSSSYATVERALDNPKTAAALARRIWMALVADGSEAMTAADIAEVLGPFRKEEAAELFKVLDENESGDMRLEEMVWTVVESGRVRHTIYQSMADVDHCINTFDWVCLTILGLVMIAFICEYMDCSQHSAKPVLTPTSDPLRALDQGDPVHRVLCRHRSQLCHPAIVPPLLRRCCLRLLRSPVRCRRPC